MHINFTEKFTVAFSHGQSLCSGGICCLLASLAFPSSLFPPMINILLLSGWAFFFSFSCFHRGMKTKPGTSPALPSDGNSGGSLSGNAAGWGRDGAYPFAFLVECVRFHLYNELANPQSEMSSLTRHRKRIRTLTQPRKMQFSLCNYRKNASSSRGHTQPAHKNAWKTLAENSKFTEAKTQSLPYALTLLMIRGNSAWFLTT